MAVILSSLFELTPTSFVLAVLGIYICGVGQISYLIKEKLYLSPALLSVLVGIACGPVGLGLIDPLAWAANSQDALVDMTYQITRIVVGIQVAFAGIELPSAYLLHEWRSVLALLGPVMGTAWMVVSAIIYFVIPGLTFLEATIIGAAVAPTDPILASALVKGRFAEDHVPKRIRDLISAESGANDGLGYPFIFLGLILCRDRAIGERVLSESLIEWIFQTWLYEVLLACIIGAFLGWLARVSLVISHERGYIDDESFLSFGVGMAFTVLGITGLLGSDDVLASFVAGNVLTLFDFYRSQSAEDAFQDTIDQILNSSIFIFVGAIIPWQSFTESIQLGPVRLIMLALLVLLLRRLPAMLAMYSFIPAISSFREAVFVGHFGPMGVSALFYAALALRELPAERERLREVIVPVVLFLALSSTIVHGMTIPVLKHGSFGLRHLTRTMSAVVRFKRNGEVAAARREAAGPSQGRQGPIALPIDVEEEEDDEEAAVAVDNARQA